jgi:hypothetical protein
VDDETRLFFDRLLREATEIRRSLDENGASGDSKLASLRDEMLTHFDALFKENGDRRTEYVAVSAAMSRLEASVARVERDSREHRITQQQVQSDVHELRLLYGAIEQRVTQLEAALRNDHDA